MLITLVVLIFWRFSFQARIDNRSIHSSLALRTPERWCFFTGS